MQHGYVPLKHKSNFKTEIKLYKWLSYKSLTHPEKKLKTLRLKDR